MNYLYEKTACLQARQVDLEAAACHMEDISNTPDPKANERLHEAKVAASHRPRAIGREFGLMVLRRTL